MNSMKNIENTDLYNEILRYVQSRVFNKNDADDIVQDTFRDFLASTFTSTDKKEIHAFIYKIVLRRIVDWQRIKLGQSTVYIESGDFAAQQDVDYGIVEEVMAILLPLERKVVECKQLSDKDGAAELGLNINTFRSCRSRARQKIEKYLEVV